MVIAEKFFEDYHRLSEDVERSKDFDPAEALREVASRLTNKGALRRITH